MNAQQIVTALAAIAQEHRLQAFRFLVQRGAEGAAAGAIAEHLSIPASSLSFHLAQLERAGLVVRVRKSRSLIYSADFAAMAALVGYLTENCCGGAETCLPAKAA
jgi:DNA-binding transcriptional ArsR family regulator